ncbi:MAG TPA: ATP-binding protein [Kofleriaceae bacterium]|jgi:hypothetical protein
MNFMNRDNELRRLSALADSPEGGFAVVFGRRRVGKTRLLLEWCRRSGGVYVVGDQSSADLQRAYCAEAIAARFPGFGDAVYPHWRSLFETLARAAKTEKWRGPLVIDELPYWVQSSPELPSVLQRFVDHQARAAGLVVAVSGSSQRMMQGIVLDGNAPLYGRAQALFEVKPLDIGYIDELAGRRSARQTLDFYSAWGGVPRYWELAEKAGEVADAICALVLDPGGPLYDEPERLLLEEMPSIAEVRPVLDAIGGGAHRASEIAARVGRPMTSLSRPLARLQELGLVARDIPFGESPRNAKKTLYRIADPFMRLWFRVVAPHRAELVSGSDDTRRELLARYWPQLVGQTWEELCRARVSKLPESWKPAQRWWQGSAPEWDIVAEDPDGKRLLLGEAKVGADVAKLAAEVAARAAPVLPAKYAKHRVTRAVFVPEATRRTQIGDITVISLRDLAVRA